jgi:hypothetical protein
MHWCSFVVDELFLRGITHFMLLLIRCVDFRALFNLFCLSYPLCSGGHFFGDGNLGRDFEVLLDEEKIKFVRFFR